MDYYYTTDGIVLGSKPENDGKYQKKATMAQDNGMLSCASYRLANYPTLDYLKCPLKVLAKCH